MEVSLLLWYFWNRDRLTNITIELASSGEDLIKSIICITRIICLMENRLQKNLIFKRAMVLFSIKDKKFVCWYIIHRTINFDDSFYFLSEKNVKYIFFKPTRSVYLFLFLVTLKGYPQLFLSLVWWLERQRLEWLQDPPETSVGLFRPWYS